MPPTEWTAEQETECDEARKRVISFHFGRYRKELQAEAEAAKMRPDPEPLPVTPPPSSKAPQYSNALGQCYGLNSKGNKSHRPMKEQDATATDPTS